MLIYFLFALEAACQDNIAKLLAMMISQVIIFVDLRCKIQWYAIAKSFTLK